MREKFYQYILELQNKITIELEKLDGQASFKEDLWDRCQGGGGKTKVLEGGAVFEKAGVNTSAVFGELPVSMQNYFGVNNAQFYACGLSLVIHPKSPMVPTVHANWRYFEMYDTNGQVVKSWFGGGMDLTPYYLFEQDVIHFHSVCKSVCDAHGMELYADFKKQCDEYFYNPHRSESRGVGGLFFDRLSQNQDRSMNQWFEFVCHVGDNFLDAYLPIVARTKNLTYTEENIEWQQIRRGRYVEFNLVHDKGTIFGLKTNGRIESILMSLPPVVKWIYDFKVQQNSQEQQLLEVLKRPKEWVASNTML